MVHSSISKGLVTLNGNILTTGGAGNLAKGQLALITDKAVAGGAKAVSASDFAGMPKNQKLKLRLGRSVLPKGLRTPYAKQYETSYFTPQDIVSITGNFPKNQVQTFDKFLIGYDGVNADTALNIPEGKSSILDITLSGKAIELFAGTKEHTFKFHFGREVGQTTQEVVRKLVEEIADAQTPRSLKKFTEFVKVGVVDSSNVALTSVASVFSSITIADNGDSNDLGDIQAQYPLYDVVRTARNGKESVYTILRPQASTLANYSLVQNASYVKGCANCLPTYTSIVGGVVYHITLEDNGVSQVALVQALPTAVAGTATKLGQVSGKGVYAVVLTTALTSTQIATFVATNAITLSAEVKKIGTTETVCEKVTPTTYTWVDGQVCRTSTEAYTIQLADSDCGTTRLAELQLAYPGLTIIEALPAQVGGCQRVYSTTVKSSIVCSECSPIFLQPFKTEEPKAFENTPWKKVATPFSATALMGITFEGLPFSITPSESSREEIPFYETSTRIKSIAGGYREMDNLNFIPAYTYDEMFDIRRLSRAVDRDALGAMLFPIEEISRVHFLGEQSEYNNRFAKANLGEESLFKFTSQYVSYQITWKDTKMSQGMGGNSNINHTEQIFVEFGYHDAIEAVVNALAVKAGVETVNPTAN
jgi:hypothetical protein